MAELIIFVGVPGAGKTTWYRQHYAATHVHVSKDLMTNARNREQRQRELIDAALAAGQSVVVDNTNPTVYDRAPLIAIGKRHAARVVACFFDTPVRTAFARNRGREGKSRVPDAAVFTVAKRLKVPEVSEGFDEVRVIRNEAGEQR